MTARPEDVLPGIWGLTSAVPAPAGAAVAASAALLTQIRAALGRAWDADPGPLGLAQACPACGADGHGAPRLTGLPPGRTARVSFTHVRDPRTGARRRLGAWWAPEPSTPARPGALGLGVDVERADAPAFAAEDGLGAVGLSSAERARVRALAPGRRPAERARLWTRKEALAKAAGTGFTGDPADVDALAAPAGVVLLDLAGRLPDGLVGALALRTA